IRRAQEVGDLPSDYFALIPEIFSDSLPTLDPVRYSIETERDVRVGNDEELEIVTQSRMEDASGARPTIRHPQGNISTESHAVGSLGDILPDHGLGVDGADVGKPAVNQEDRATGIQGDDDGDNGGDSYSLH
ncbi:hypothetical protein MPER_00042, partial [Moniliophthora perniciosa FA553]